VAKAIAKKLQSAAGETVGSRGGPGMAAIFGPGRTDYSAVDGPGGPLSRGDCPWRDKPTPCKTT